MSAQKCDGCAAYSVNWASEPGWVQLTSSAPISVSVALGNGVAKREGYPARQYRGPNVMNFHSPECFARWIDKGRVHPPTDDEVTKS